MDFNRLIGGLRNISRFPEVMRCFGSANDPLQSTLAYLRVTSLEYPKVFRLKNGIEIELNSWEDLTTAWVVFFGNEYEVRETDETILDLGGNLGMFSLHAAATCPEAKIYCCEPFPSTFEKLQENLSKSSFSNRIMPLQIAAVGRSGPIYMDASEGIPSHSRTVNEEKGIEVEGLSLPDLLEKLKLSAVDLLKIDIEGAEYALIEHTDKETLRKAARIGLEYHGNGDSSALIQRILDAGFSETRHDRRGDAGVVGFERRD